MVKQFTKEECLKWFKNPNRNPRTDYKIKKESKHSIYKQLLSDCSKYMKKELKSESKSDSKSDSSSSSISSISSSSSSLKLDNNYYPDNNDEDFDIKIASMKDFEIYKESELDEVVDIDDFNKKMIESCPKDQFNKAYFQYFVSQYISQKTPYHSLMLYYTVGTGKTCAAVSIAESMLLGHNNNEEDPPILVILPTTLINNFKNTIYNLLYDNVNQCTENIYKSMLMNYNEETKKSKLNNLINKRYNILTYYNFIKYIQTVKNINNKTIIIDEVHNLRNPEELDLDNDEKRKLKDSFKNIKDAIKNGKNNRLILMSGTPMYNEPNEIIDLFNLLLLNDKKPEIKKIDNENIAKISKSYVSYINSKNPFVYPIRLRHIDATKGDDTPDGIIKVELNPDQLSYIKKNIIKNNLIHSTSVSNIIYDKDINKYNKIFTKTNNKFKYKNIEILSEKNINNYTPKIEKICSYLKNSKGIVIIYSQFIEHGIFPMAIALEHMGYSRFIDKNKTSNLLDHKIKSNNKKYAVITSSSQELFSDVGNEKNIENILNIVNSDENLDGELLKIILITKKASEGLSFMNVREIHILDPWYHFNRNEQIIGRGFRRCSHIKLPIESRNINIFTYYGIFKNNEKYSPDLHILKIAKEKFKKSQYIIKLIEENSLDNIINEKLNIFPRRLFNKINPIKLVTSQNDNIEYYIGDDKEYKKSNFKLDERNVRSENMLIVNRLMIMLIDIMKKELFLEYDEIKKRLKFTETRYLDLAIKNIIYPNRIDNFILYWNNNGIQKVENKDNIKQVEFILPLINTKELKVDENLEDKLNKLMNEKVEFNLLYNLLMFINNKNWYNIVSIILSNKEKYNKILKILKFYNIIVEDYYFDLFNNLELKNLDGEIIDKEKYKFKDQEVNNIKLYGKIGLNKKKDGLIFIIIRENNLGTNCETQRKEELVRLLDGEIPDNKKDMCIEIAKKFNQNGNLKIIPYIKMNK